jgi:hypothetical protein
MINRRIAPDRAKGIFAGMNPEFGNYLTGNIAENSRVTYPNEPEYSGASSIDTQGEDAWIGFPARVMTQEATANPTLMDPGSNLDAVNRNFSLAQKAGLDGNIATGDPQGVGYMASGI